VAVVWRAAFDADGGLADPRLAERFEQTIAGFMDLAEAARRYPCNRRAWV
jgi:chromate reductase